MSQEKHEIKFKILTDFIEPEKQYCLVNKQWNYIGTV